MIAQIGNHQWPLSGPGSAAAAAGAPTRPFTANIGPPVMWNVVWANQGHSIHSSSLCALCHLLLFRPSHAGCSHTQGGGAVAQGLCIVRTWFRDQYMPVEVPIRPIQTECGLVAGELLVYLLDPTEASLSKAPLPLILLKKMAASSLSHHSIYKMHVCFQT